MGYNFKEIEANCQDKWQDFKVFSVDIDSNKDKYYILEMFSLSFRKYTYGTFAKLYNGGRCSSL